jgi:hypothetical protein
MGLKLAEKCKEIGVEVVFTYPDQPHEKYKNTTDFLIERLKK